MPTAATSASSSSRSAKCRYAALCETPVRRATSRSTTPSGPLTPGQLRRRPRPAPAGGCRGGRCSRADPTADVDSGHIRCSLDVVSVHIDSRGPRGPMSASSASCSRSARPSWPSTSTRPSSTSRCRASPASSTPAPATCSGSSTATTWPSPHSSSPRAASPTGTDAVPALIIGLLGFAAASAVGALVTLRRGALVAARVVMGVFAALIFPTTLSIISNTFRDRKERAAALGVWGAVVGVGVAAGPVTGGAAARALLLGQRVLGARAARAAGRAGGVPRRARVPRPRRSRALDLAGLVAVRSRCSACSPTRSSRRPSRGWASAETLGGFALQRRPARWRSSSSNAACAHPMLDVSLFRDRRFSAASGAVTVTFFALFGFIFLITQYFQFVRGYGTLSTGARILPVALSIAVASVVGAHARAAHRHRASSSPPACCCSARRSSGSRRSPSTRRTPT